METGLLVTFTNIDKVEIEEYLKHSDFYGEEVEPNIYLFPSQKSEYDILEKALRLEFERNNIFATFEGI